MAGRIGYLVGLGLLLQTVKVLVKDTVVRGPNLNEDTYLRKTMDLEVAHKENHSPSRRPWRLFGTLDIHTKGSRKG